MAAVAVALGSMVGVESANAETKAHYQRVEPPPNAYPGLLKVVLVEHGNAWNKVYVDRVAIALRGSLGHKNNLPEAGPGLRPDVINFARDRGPAIPSASDVMVLTTRHVAQAALVARIEATHDTRRYTGNRSSTHKNDAGETVTDKWTVPCEERTARIEWTSALYAASDGSLMFESGKPMYKSRKDCDEKGDDRLSLPSHNDMTQELVEKAADMFALSFSPSWGTFKVTWEWDKSSAGANDLAKDRSWSAAVEEAFYVLEADPYNSRAVYLVGLALEIGGRPGDAAVLYRLAGRMGEPKLEPRLYRRAASRADDRTAQLAELAGYGQGVEPVEFRGVEPLLQRARGSLELPRVGERTTIRGAKNKRVPLLGPEKSEVIARVPGGTVIDRIQVAGKLVHVQLPDGVQGWVDKKYVKK